MKISEIIKILSEEHNLLNLFWFNFHKVDDGVYRSAQLMPWRLKKIIKKYNIKTVINLRGNNKNYLYSAIILKYYKMYLFLWELLQFWE